MIAANSTEQALANPRIPGELAELAARVTRDTRLWPSERRDVRAELESHFREGMLDLLDQGMSLDQCITILREQFGDAAVAARLIRRAKKRARPMAYKLALFAGCMALAGMASAAGYAAWLFGGKPNPTVDYVAKINESVEAIPPADRAWPLLRDAALAFEPPPESLDGRMPRPGDDDWDTAVAWAQDNRGILPLLREAASKPAYGFVYDDDQAHAFIEQLMRRRGELPEGQAYDRPPPDPLMPPLLATLLPSLTEFRSMARFLVLDARVRLEAGELARAVASLDLGSSMGVQLLGGHTLIEQLVGAAILRLVLPELRSVVYDHRTELAAGIVRGILESRVMTFDPGTLAMHLEGERYMFLDVVQYLFTDDGQGNGHIIPEQYERLRPILATDDGGMAVLAIATRHADRKTTVEKYDEVWEALSEVRSRPLYDPTRGEELQVLNQLTGQSVDRYQFALLHVLIPSLARADEHMRRLAMEVQATRTALAIAAFEHEHGRPPGALEELARASGLQIPEDIYSRDPLRFHSENGATLLYSVGENLIDDGGSVADVDSPTHQRTVPADIVFWPPPGE